MCTARTKEKPYINKHKWMDKLNETTKTSKPCCRLRRSSNKRTPTSGNPRNFKIFTTEVKEEETFFFFHREPIFSWTHAKSSHGIVRRRRRRQKKFLNGRRPTTIKKDVCQKITTVAEPCIEGSRFALCVFCTTHTGILLCCRLVRKLIVIERRSPGGRRDHGKIRKMFTEHSGRVIQTHHRVSAAYGTKRAWGSTLGRY